MTPKEAADLVLTCTATGVSGLPLWELMPGMLVTWETARHITKRRVLSGAVRPGYLSYEYDELHVEIEREGWLPLSHLAKMGVRPDFTDALTVQALYLLVVRAWIGHALAVFRGRDVLDDRALPPNVVRFIVCAPNGDERFSEAGPAYAVFARALAQAPTRDVGLHVDDPRRARTAGAVPKD